MEERQFRLITKAHTKGVIDYSQYRRYDINWDLKEHFIIRELKDDLYLEVQKSAIYAYGAAISAATPGTEVSVNYHEKLFLAHDNLISIVLPWLDRKFTDKKVLDEAQEAWGNFEEYQQTDEYKSQMERNAKIFKENEDYMETDRKLADLVREGTSKKSTKERVKF